MLHGFNAADGTEVFAYVPRTTMKKLYLLTSTTYGTNHEFTTDGSPAVADVKLTGGWATMLVAGLNGGGRGFYALDVTAIGTTSGSTPGTAKAMWELCADPTVCANNDPDIGLTFGNPQFGTWNGKWVVFLTSGYNNIPGADNVNLGSGQGILFIVDANTGAILKKVSTGAGNTTTPSGLAKITAIGPSPDTDPTVSYIYGGDNNGSMWRFDLTDTSSAATVGVIKMGDAGSTAPITTRPDVTLCAVTTTVTDPTTHLTSTSSVAQRVVVFGTGRLLDVPDTTDTSLQSLYVLKDSGANISNIRGSTMVQQTLSLAGSSSNVNTYAITNNPVDLSVKNGWFVDWNLNAGERMNLDPQIVGGLLGGRHQQQLRAQRLQRQRGGRHPARRHAVEHLGGGGLHHHPPAERRPEDDHHHGGRQHHHHADRHQHHGAATARRLAPRQGRVSPGRGRGTASRPPAAPPAFCGAAAISSHERPNYR